MIATVPTSKLLTDVTVASLLEAVLLPGAEDTAEVGDCIGHYRLVEKLGEGGFGVVWRAEQGSPVRREVALKMIKLGMDSREVLARFEQERQTLATMGDARIASMLEAGMAPDGRPYFVMELVHGLPITRYCAEHQTPLRDRVTLFKEVCLGVQHAHQKGIIHRDLKPTNILVTEVDGLPVPKIIDFGIAKAMTTTRLASMTQATRSGVLIGTPLYMSPEQLANVSDADTRSDIYSLGALLYELLTGQPPFDAKTLTGKGQDEMRRIIREVRPPKPSRRLSDQTKTLGRRTQNTQDSSPVLRPSTISGDLDWIILCALEKDPRRRYPSAAEFAADLQRFLDDEPVIAHPPAATYIVARWIRRHRRSFAAACISTLALLCGTGVALWQAAEARREKEAAEVQTSRAVQAEAEAQIQAVRAQQTAEFLTRLLGNAADEIAKGRNPEALKLALDRSGTELTELERNPSLQILLLDRMISLYTGIADWKTALELMNTQASVLARLHGAESGEARQAELTYLKRYADHGQRTTVPPLLEALKARLEQQGERGSLFWLEVQRERARVWLKLDSNQQALDCSEEAMAEATLKKLKGKPLVSVMMTHVASLEAAKDFEAAEALLDRCRQTLENFPNSGNLLRQINDRLLFMLKAKGDFARGAQIQREQLNKVRATSGTDPREIIRLLDRLSHFESASNQHEQAVQHGLEALEIARQQAAGSGKDRDTFRAAIGQGLRRLCEIESSVGHYDDAIRYAAEARENADAQGNKFDLYESIETLANAQRDAGRLDDAYRSFEEYHRLRQTRSADHRTRVKTLEELRDIRMTQGRYEEALELSRQMWPVATDGPAALLDTEHLGNCSRFALAAWAALHKARPDSPSPPELLQWTAASEILTQLEASRKKGR